MPNLAPIVCGFCGVPVPRSGKPGQPSRFCSDEHRRKAAVLRTTLWQKDNRERTLVNRRNANRTHYKRNREAMIERAIRYQKDNPERRKAQDRRYYERHTDKWRQKASATAAARVAAKPDKWCVWCGELLPRSMRADAKYCPNGICKKRAHDKALALRLEIAERDGWVCKLCGGHIDKHGKGYWALEVDHVHPRSKGGSDDPENLQAAHMICNRRKAARLI